jgi:hypothetical protein
MDADQTRNLCRDKLNLERKGEVVKHIGIRLENRCNSSKRQRYQGEPLRYIGGYGHKRASPAQADPKAS